MRLTHDHFAVQSNELVIHQPDEERSIVTVAVLNDEVETSSSFESLLPHQHALVAAHNYTVAAVHLFFLLCIQMF